MLASTADAFYIDLQPHRQQQLSRSLNIDVEMVSNAGAPFIFLVLFIVVAYLVAVSLIFYW